MASADKKGSILGLLVPVLLLTIAAAGGGVLVARQVVEAAKAAAAGMAPPPAKPDAAMTPEGLPPSQTAVKELQPVLTNLAAPEGAVVRLQAAIVYDKAFAPQVDVVAATIGDDTLAYMKSLTVGQLQGAEGLQHLREDLGERATLRSDGHVRAVLIEALVIQ